MKNEAWLDRWQGGNTGWHELDGNRNLREHWQWSGKRVLVPLCGKTPDLLWLESKGNEVVGVELSDLAVRAFFEDNSLEYEEIDGRLAHYRAVDRRISLYCGDYFGFEGQSFDAHYDRGGLVALLPELRIRYAKHTSSLLDRGADQFVVTVEYDQAVCGGPPFSISQREIQGHWPRLQRHVTVDDTANAPPKFREAGLEEMNEVVWRTV